jgi:hypothetical protein
VFQPSGGCGHISIAGRRSPLTRETTATTPTRPVTGLRLETVASVGIAVNADHRKDDDGRGYGIGVDVFAAASKTRLVGKPYNFAHYNPLFRSTPGRSARRIGALFRLKGLQG